MEDLELDMKKDLKNKANEILENNIYICDGFILNDSKTNLEDIKGEETYLILKDPGLIGFVNENNDRIKCSIIPDESIFRRGIEEDKILLKDHFNRQERNSDYLDVEEEFFSADHLYYISDKFKGFGDFSIIGEDYSESGFAPYAVSIHIVFFDENQQLKIKHFTSDSNTGIDNPAKKYNEAVKKLSEWYKEQEKLHNPEYVLQNIYTESLQEFINHSETGNYSGLGVVKKLSLKHHLELMGKYLFNDGVL